MYKSVYVIFVWNGTDNPLTLIYWRGGGYHPLEDSFQATKMLVSATNWLQLIVGSSFVVILAKKLWPPYLGVGVG